MLNPITENFLSALRPGHREEGEGSVYHRATNMTSGVLVVNEDEDSTLLVQECFEHRFPVAVDLVRHDPDVPRIETASQQIVGQARIRSFLASR